MDEPRLDSLSPEELPPPKVQILRRPSVVWLIPIVAALIGAWLAFRAFATKGPSITITFQSAEGLEAGRTRIKY
jgi:paraquat-inducible protein B